MEHLLVLAILSGLGSMFGWGFADFFAKKTIDKTGDVTTLFWSQLIGIVPLGILFAFNPEIPHLGNISVLLLIVLGIWSGLSYIPTYVAFGKGKVSLLSPIFSTYAVVVTILSAAFFGEFIPFGREIAFAIVFIGIVLINGDVRDLWRLISGQKRKGEEIKGLKEILLAIAVYSLWIIALDRFLVGQNWVPILLAIRIFSALSLFIYSKVRKIDLVIYDRGLWKYLILIGTFDVAAFAFLSFGISKTPFVSIVAMLGGAFSLPTIILARIFLKEKVTCLQTVGSIVIIGGIMLLSLL